MMFKKIDVSTCEDLTASDINEIIQNAHHIHMRADFYYAEYKKSKGILYGAWLARDNIKTFKASMMAMRDYENSKSLLLRNYNVMVDSHGSLEHYHDETPIFEETA